MKTAIHLTILLLLGLFLSCKVAAQDAKVLDANLDPLVTLPGAYGLKPDDLEKLFEKGGWSRNPYFEWLTKDKSRAIFKKK
ncbi:MAG: hypothetical protein MI807_18290, partial [Verrucomicrobiales bacterium]|nr:hypothetical protein [Verrucomicrobiales bacterium]